MVQNKNTVIEEKELTEKEIDSKIRQIKVKKFKKNLYRSLPFILVSFIALILTITTYCLYGSFDNRFISPTSQSIYNQKEDLYIISTYISTDSSSKTFVKELRKLEKEYDIPFYLVDVVEYEELVEIWELEYSPTYFVINKNKNDKKELLYKSYGAKKYNVLNAEVEYCKMNGGVPIDHRGEKHTDDVTGLEMTLDSVEKTSSGNVEITFTIVNNGNSSVDFKNSFVKTKDYNSKKTGTNLKPNVTTKVGVGEEKEITVAFSGIDPLKVNISIDLSSITETNSTYSWIISKLEYSLNLDEIE